MLTLLALSPAAYAFCGTYVGGPDDTLVNHASRVILAREGEHTVLTVAMDYEGSPSEFALLLPVPTVLQAEDVTTIDPWLVDAMDEWTTPRVSAYTCADVTGEVHQPGNIGCAVDNGLVSRSTNDSGSVNDSGGVTVESSFSVAGYDIVVLSAEESQGLTGWLDDNGYALPPGGDDVLQEYIDGGSYFLAARVSIDLSAEQPDGPTWLPPLQFAYDSPVFGLPIRIGTISADGDQEVLVYVLGDSYVGISNYPERTVEDECMWQDGGGGFTEFYEDQLDGAFAEGAGWLAEYNWSLTQNCDPCTGVGGFSPEQLLVLGRENYHGFVSRLRLRYAPEEALQDVVLYETNQGEEYANGEQIRYIQYLEELESTFPVCGEGFVADPGTCATGKAEVGCAVPVGTSSAGGAGVLLAIAALRRRR